MSIAENINKIKSEISTSVKLVAVSKTYPSKIVLEAYQAGQKIFGENKVQELVKKYEELPKDIEWHLIGHLQSNKVKQIASFVSLIHSVDSLKLLQEINKCAIKENRIIDCLLQIYIAKEDTKFGLSFEEAEALLTGADYKLLKNIRIVGLMGMASFTTNEGQIKQEFNSLKLFFDKLKKDYPEFLFLSSGMSSDYKIAIKEGSTLVRIGSSIFGRRN